MGFTFVLLPTIHQHSSYYQCGCLSFDHISLSVKFYGDIPRISPFHALLISLTCLLGFPPTLFPMNILTNSSVMLISSAPSLSHLQAVKSVLCCILRNKFKYQEPRCILLVNAFAFSSLQLVTVRGLRMRCYKSEQSFIL